MTLAIFGAAHMNVESINGKLRFTCSHCHASAEVSEPTAGETADLVFAHEDNCQLFARFRAGQKAHLN